MDHTDLVTIAIFLHRGEAEVARARLADGGVSSLVQQDDEGGLNPGFFRDYGVRLVVAQSDAAAADAILDDGT
ncbi:MAG: hypothetical protein ACE5GC_03515 [Acidimicrobiia bacterium]